MRNVQEEEWKMDQKETPEKNPDDKAQATPPPQLEQELARNADVAPRDLYKDLRAALDDDQWEQMRESAVRLTVELAEDPVWLAQYMPNLQQAQIDEAREFLAKKAAMKKESEMKTGRMR